MKNFSLPIILRKAASQYYAYLWLYLGLGVLVTFIGWLGHAVTSYFSDRCGYLAFRPLSLDSVDILVTYISRLIHFHPLWLVGFVIVCAVAKLVEFACQCSVYALALQISSGSSITRKSFVVLIKHVGAVFVRYVLATIFYGTIIAFTLRSIVTPWSFLSFLPFSSAVKSGIAVVGTLVFVCALVRYVSLNYFYPYILLEKNIGAWESFQHSQEMVGFRWKKVAVLAALLFAPLVNVWSLSLYFPTEWFGGAVLCGFLSVGIIAPFTALAMAHVYRSLV